MADIEVRRCECRRPVLVTCSIVMILTVLGLVTTSVVLYSKYEDSIMSLDMPSDMRLLELPFFDRFCDQYKIQTTIPDPDDPRKNSSNSEPWFDLYMMDTDPRKQLTPKRTATNMTGISHIRPYMYDSFLFHLIYNSSVGMTLDVTNCYKCNSSFAVFVLKGWKSFQDWTGSLRADRYPDCIQEEGCVYRSNISNVHESDKKIRGTFGTFTCSSTDDYTIVLYGLNSTIPSCKKSRSATMEFVVNRTLYDIPDSAIIKASRMTVSQFYDNSGYFVITFQPSYSSLVTPGKTLQDIKVYVECKRAVVGFFEVFGIPAIGLLGLTILVMLCAWKNVPGLDEERQRLLEDRANIEGSMYEPNQNA